MCVLTVNFLIRFMKCLTSETLGGVVENCFEIAHVLPVGECMAVIVEVMKLLIKNFIAVLHLF